MAHQRQMKRSSSLSWVLRKMSGLFGLIAYFTMKGGLLAVPQPSAIFSDHAVLQGGQKVPVWGTSSPGEKVSVRFSQQQADAVADAKGRWRVELPPLEKGASGELSVVGETTFIAKDVVVGDVWLCSGQSNMGFSIKRSENGAAEIAAANFPKIRMFRVDRTSSQFPVSDPPAKWVVCAPENVAGWTAVGYFFARDIHQTQGVPVGLIQASWGGTDIEGWMSPESVNASGSASAVRERWKQLLAEYPEAIAAYETHIAASREKSNAEDEDGVPPKTKLKKPKGPDSAAYPGNLFNGMIYPLIPYAISGIVWYQGENNTVRTGEYGELLRHLIRDWRQRWGNSELPFLYVQLPNYAAGKPLGTGWAEFRDVQAAMLAEPAAHMAVTIDLGTSGNVHPNRKREVGERLALLARKYVYGEKIGADAPSFKTSVGEGDVMKVEFNVDTPPLVLRMVADNSSFEIAGADKKFFQAEVRLEGSSVYLTSAKVSQPVFARYAWKNDPPATLFDSAGLAARPFRTDH